MHRKRFSMPCTSAVPKALLFVFSVFSQETKCFLELLTGCVHTEFFGKHRDRCLQPGSKRSKPVLTALSRARMKREFRSFPPWAQFGGWTHSETNTFGSKSMDFILMHTMHFGPGIDKGLLGVSYPRSIHEHQLHFEEPFTPFHEMYRNFGDKVESCQFTPLGVGSL